MAGRFAAEVGSEEAVRGVEEARVQRSSSRIASCSCKFYSQYLYISFHSPRKTMK